MKKGLKIYLSSVKDQKALEDLNIALGSIIKVKDFNSLDHIEDLKSSKWFEYLFDDTVFNIQQAKSYLKRLRFLQNHLINREAALVFHLKSLFSIGLSSFELEGFITELQKNQSNKSKVSAAITTLDKFISTGNSKYWEEYQIIEQYLHTKLSFDEVCILNHTFSGSEDQVFKQFIDKVLKRGRKFAKNLSKKVKANFIRDIRACIRDKVQLLFKNMDDNSGDSNHFVKSNETDYYILKLNSYDTNTINKEHKYSASIGYAFHRAA